MACAVLAALGMVMAACGGAATPDGGDDASGGDPQAGGIVTYLHTIEVRSWDTAQLQAAS